MRSRPTHEVMDLLGFSVGDLILSGTMERCFQTVFCERLSVFCSNSGFVIPGKDRNLGPSNGTRIVNARLEFFRE